MLSISKNHTMDDADRRLIERFAAGDEDARGPAINAYHRNLMLLGARGNDHMCFMSEVLSPVPDLYLRRVYRDKIVGRS